MSELMNKPLILALFLMGMGITLLLIGVFLLAGAGWACVVASLPPFLVATIFFKGLKRAE